MLTKDQEQQPFIQVKTWKQTSVRRSSASRFVVDCQGQIYTSGIKFHTILWETKQLVLKIPTLGAMARMSKHRDVQIRF